MRPSDLQTHAITRRRYAGANVPSPRIASCFRRPFSSLAPSLIRDTVGKTYLKSATFEYLEFRCPARGESQGLLGLTRIVLQEFFKGVERLLREPFARIVPGDDLEGVFVIS
jgi:hypothetical protein